MTTYNLTGLRYVSGSNNYTVNLTSQRTFKKILSQCDSQGIFNIKKLRSNKLREITGRVSKLQFAVENSCCPDNSFETRRFFISFQNWNALNYPEKIATTIN